MEDNIKPDRHGNKSRTTRLLTYPVSDQANRVETVGSPVVTYNKRSISRDERN